MGRNYNGAQRAVLYWATNGRCANCGVELTPGWHADHVHPYSAGGPTDVINGQALCPPCNLRKGATVFQMRTWQRQAMETFRARKQQDFLLAATPAAGKTWVSLSLAKQLLGEGTVEKIIMVVPTDALRQQWVDDAAKCGLSLMPVRGPEDYEKAGYQGCVATYAQVAQGVGFEQVRHLTRVPTLAILDEIHHAGDDKAWGKGLRGALEKATYRLALTGTPWRKDRGSQIPFVTYDENERVRPDYEYKYGEAVADGVCRRVEFHAYGGDGRWRDCGKISSAELGADLSDEDVSALLDTVYDPKNSWMPALLREAGLALDEIRAEIPDAAGLVVAERQKHAYAYADLIEEQTGTRPVVAVSDDPDSKEAIDRFRGSRDKWIVAVRMVSEGVDIPRLAVGVYASKIRTPLFFRQVVGRLVRVRSGEELNARLLIPAVPVLMAHGREIEGELLHQRQLETEKYEKERAEAQGSQQVFELRQPLSASEAVFDRAILGGDDTTPEEYELAQEECRRRGVPVQWALNLAPLFRRTMQPTMGEITITKPPSPEPRHRVEKMLRDEIVKLVNEMARMSGADQKEVNTNLLKAGFPRRKHATIEELEAMREYLAARIGEL
jgi:superfamily II DNA or RNA helicase